MIVQPTDSNTPKVTVLMSVCNGESFLREAVESILNQTFRDFEFLIINDGSTDGTLAILTSYNDSRIRIVDNQENIGLTKSLNRGLAMARGQYIVRQDADDISLTKRIQNQVAFMDTNQDVMLLGAQAYILYENTIFCDSSSAKATSYEGILWQMTIDSAFFHTSVIFRKEIVLNEFTGYNESFVTGQDADLWSRIASFYPVRNLADKLVVYREHKGSIGQGKHRGTDQSVQGGIKVFSRCIRRLFPERETIAEWAALYMDVYTKKTIKAPEHATALLDGIKNIYLAAELKLSEDVQNLNIFRCTTISKLFMILRYFYSQQCYSHFFDAILFCARVDITTAALLVWQKASRRALARCSNRRVATP